MERRRVGDVWEGVGGVGGGKVSGRGVGGVGGKVSGRGVGGVGGGKVSGRGVRGVGEWKEVGGWREGYIDYLYLETRSRAAQITDGQALPRCPSLFQRTPLSSPAQCASYQGPSLSM